jgi:O-antigen/teichoic acid export membrane protein
LISLGRFVVTPRFVMLSSFGGTSLLNYAFGLILGWLLLPGDFGWLAFAQTMLLVAGMVLQSGFSLALARAITNSGGDRRDALVRGALVANLALATAMGATVVALYILGPLKPGLETAMVAALVALSLPFISLAATARGGVQGSERFGMVASLQLVEISCKVLAGTALVLLGFGVAGAVAGFLLGGIVATALGFYYLVYKLGVRLRGTFELPTLRVVAPMLGALLGLSLVLNLDLVALKLLSGERALAGYYQAGIVLANAPYYLVMSALVPILFVQLARFDNVAATTKAVGETLKLTIALVLPIELILMISPHATLITLFPSSYAPGAPSLRLLAIGNSLLILVGILSATFQAIGRAQIPALILLMVAFAEPIVLWIVVPAQEALGAASVFIGASATALLSLGAVYLRGVGAGAVRQAASWLYRYVAALGIGVTVGYAVLGSGFGIELAVVVGGLCYLGAALTLRLVFLPSLRIRLLSGKPVLSEEE